MSTIVLARAYRGEPLKRVSMYADEKNVYLANPALMQDVEAGLTSPIGFPTIDVFCWKSDSYERLLSLWNKEHCVPDDAWTAERLTRYSFVK